MNNNNNKNEKKNNSFRKLSLKEMQIEKDHKKSQVKKR